jgi:hypothetical protein
MYYTPDWLIRAVGELKAAMPCQCWWCRLKRWLSLPHSPASVSRPEGPRGDERTGDGRSMSDNERNCEITLMGDSIHEIIVVTVEEVLNEILEVVDVSTVLEYIAERGTSD